MTEGRAEEAKAEWDYKGDALISHFNFLLNKNKKIILVLSLWNLVLFLYFLLKIQPYRLIKKYIPKWYLTSMNKKIFTFLNLNETIILFDIILLNHLVYNISLSF